MEKEEYGISGWLNLVEVDWKNEQRRMVVHFTVLFVYLFCFLFLFFTNSVVLERNSTLESYLVYIISYYYLDPPLFN